VEDEALDVNRVLKVMEESRSRVSVVILDACRDNPFTRGFRSQTRGLAVMPAPSGTFVAYATGPGAVAADGTGRNGIFTGELLRVMRTPALDIVDVFRQVVGGVREKTRGRQVPWTLSSLDGYFYFALAKSPPPGPVAVAPTPGPAASAPTITKEVVREYGSIAIRGKLPGIEVWLDEQKIGETERGAAIVLNNVAVGTYRLRGRKTGHKEWEHEVQVAANQRAEVVIDIEPLRPEPPRAPGDDGAEMVRIPAGEFWMGADAGSLEDERPRRRVYLDAYDIDKYEVTNGLYARFMRATGRAAPASWNDATVNAERQPVVGVTWFDADAYCRWAGKRLPTEAEWEKAGRGVDGRRFPWGERFDAARLNDKASGIRSTEPVGSYPGGASPYGVHDLLGNAIEWVQDWYESGYYAVSPARNPPGPSTGSSKVRRGGSWDYWTNAWPLPHRYSTAPTFTDTETGFRCARGVR
jgi:formylglycine-generating enzyme required for sulfatase activity